MAGKTKPKRSKEVDAEVQARQNRINEKCTALGKNMQHWRDDEMDRTQTYLAEKLGKEQMQISKYENNTTRIPVEIAFGYCDVLNISISDLFGVTDIIEIKESDVLAEYRKLSNRMKYYVYQMIREMNKGVESSVK